MVEELSNLLGLADSVARGFAYGTAVFLVLGLVQWWRAGFRESTVGKGLGDPDDLRLNVTPLLFTTTAVSVGWPAGAFALMGWFSQFSFTWREGTRDDVEPPVLPSEGHFGLALLRVSMLIGVGAGLGAMVDVLLEVLSVPPTLPPVGCGGLIGGAWGLQRVTTGAPILWGWTTLILWSAFSGGDVPGQDEEKEPAKPKKRRPVARATTADPAPADPKAAARSLMAGVVARELAEIEADEEAAEEEDAAAAVEEADGDEAADAAAPNAGDDVDPPDDEPESVEQPAPVAEAADVPAEDVPEAASTDVSEAADVSTEDVPEAASSEDVAEVADEVSDAADAPPVPAVEDEPMIDEDTDEATAIEPP